MQCQLANNTSKKREMGQAIMGVVVPRHRSASKSENGGLPTIFGR